MPKRNGQNPIRMDKNPKQARGKLSNPTSGQTRTTGIIQCPDCKVDVLPKPGFRIKSLKCPKCGASLHK